MHHLQMSNLLFKVLSRIGILLLSLTGFVFITSVTALTVRVLTSSGVMVLFPFLTLFRIFGARIEEQVLDYAHPWLGMARRQVQRRGLHKFSHYTTAHICRLIVIYAMYEACQSAWSGVFYKKSVPVDLTLWIFASALIVEYFSLIYVRSALR